MISLSYLLHLPLYSSPSFHIFIFSLIFHLAVGAVGLFSLLGLSHHTFFHLLTHHSLPSISPPHSSLPPTSPSHLSLRAAMEKMKSIYSDNPSLGDVNVVTQSLVVCQRRIDELEVELEKFKVPVMLLLLY